MNPAKKTPTETPTKNKTLLIGHRGTGKSELILRMSFYFRQDQAEFIDLDLEIEKKIGKSIRQLFLEHGEAYFREMERQVFLETLQRAPAHSYMVAGAGFDLSIVPDEIRVLWVRRRTDNDGRIFLNRPRLDPELPPLEEFRKRAAARTQIYSENADEIYLMPEGHLENHHRAMATEKSVLGHSFQNLEGVLTLTADLFRGKFRWELFKSRFENRGVSYFELRDDILTLDQIKQVMDEMPQEKFILSFRKEAGFSQFLDFKEGRHLLIQASWVDWALELGTPDILWTEVAQEKTIVSSHEGRREDLEVYQSRAAHLKWAPLVNDFKDLQEHHQWHQEDPGKRSFLPRSFNGRWQWYRLYMKGRQLLNFWKEGEGSAWDQPSIFDWAMTFPKPKKFAAVLGDPIFHSYTPIEQSDYFAKKDAPVFGITISRTDWDEALPVLRGLGLSWAAVTSPHKENAASLCNSSLKALNTLFWNSSQEKWEGASTDEVGFLELIEGIGMVAPLQSEIFVWGGGGTLGMLQHALPHALYFSSRTSLSRDPQNEAGDFMPKVLIWAAPRSEETQFPPEFWQPTLVLDLNYKEDSMGKEYAQKLGANYTSGLGMFLAQAREQRVFWNKCEEKNERK